LIEFAVADSGIGMAAAFMQRLRERGWMEGRNIAQFAADRAVISL
jgi:hypothetical protein